MNRSLHCSAELALCYLESCLAKKMLSIARSRKLSICFTKKGNVVDALGLEPRTR